jgi:predicted nuclease of predicted toxin-antitoxin system
MRIKLDENLPAELVDDITGRGHDVDSVEAEGLAGQPDPLVAAAARRARRAPFTLDKGIADVRRLPPRRYGGIVLFRLRQRGRASVRRAVLEALPHLPSRLAGRLVVITESAVRIRR